jgi:hypothetical protein
MVRRRLGAGGPRKSGRADLGGRYAPGAVSDPESKPAIFALWVGRGHPERAALLTRGIDLEVVPASASIARIAAKLSDLVVLGPDARVRQASVALHAALAARGDTTLAVVDPGKSVEASEGERLGIVHLAPSLSGDELLDRLEVLACVGHLAVETLPASTRGSELAGSVASWKQARRAVVLGSADAACVVADGSVLGPLAKLAALDALTVRERPRARTSLGRTSPDRGKPAASRRLQGATILFLGPTESLGTLEASVRALGATAIALEEDAELEEASVLDPTALVLSASALDGGLGPSLLFDARLSTAALLVVDGSRMKGPAVDEETLVELVRICTREIEVKEHLELGEPSVDRIEVLGAARWLRLASRRSEPLALELRGECGVIRVELLGGKVKEATLEARSGAKGSAAAEGRDAMRALVTMGRGTAFLGEPEEVERGRALLAEVEDAVEDAAPKIDRALDRAVDPPRPRAAVPRPLAVPKPGSEKESSQAKHVVGGLLPPPAREGSRPRVPAPEGSRPRVPAPGGSRPRVPVPEGAARKPASVPLRTATSPLIEAAPIEPIETAPAETAPIETIEAAPIEPAETAPTETAPIETAPAETAETAPVETAPIETVEAAPIEAAPAETAPIETVEAAPIETPPAETAPIETAPLALPDFTVGAAAAGSASDARPAERISVGSLPSIGATDAPPPAPLMPSARPVSIPPPSSTKVPAWALGAGALAVGVAVLGAWLLLRPETATPTPIVIPRAPPPIAIVDAGVPDAPTETPEERLASLLTQLDAAREARAYPEMQRLAEAVLVLSPENAPAAHLLAVALFRQDHAEEAIVWAQRAVEWDPDEGESRLLLGDILAFRGSFSRARRVWTECAREVPLFRPCQRRIEE